MYGITLCFGWPHEAFTHGYKRFKESRLGMLQVLFSEIAEAYIKGPCTFLTGLDLSNQDAEDFNPPLGVMESLPSL